MISATSVQHFNTINIRVVKTHNINQSEMHEMMSTRQHACVKICETRMLKMQWFRKTVSGVEKIILKNEVGWKRYNGRNYQDNVQDSGHCPGFRTLSRIQDNVQDAGYCPGYRTMSRFQDNVQDTGQCPGQCSGFRTSVARVPELFIFQHIWSQSKASYVH